MIGCGVGGGVVTVWPSLVLSDRMWCWWWCGGCVALLGVE